MKGPPWEYLKYTKRNTDSSLKFYQNFSCLKSLGKFIFIFLKYLSNFVKLILLVFPLDFRLYFCHMSVT